MPRRFACCCVALLAATFAFAFAPPSSFGEEKGSTVPAPATAKPPKAEKPKGPPKFYRYKGQKTIGKGDGQILMLLVEELVSGKDESFTVQNTDPASGKFDPVKGVVDFIKELPVGTPIELRTERVKG